MADQGKSLFSELTDAEMEEKRQQLEREKQEIEEKARRLAQEAELEAQERQLCVMKKQIEKLMKARQEANTDTPVLCLENIGQDEASKKMASVLELLQAEAKEREKQKQLEIQEMEKRRIEEERARQELELHQKMEEEKRKQEEEEQKRLAEEKEKEENEKKDQKEKERREREEQEKKDKEKQDEQNKEGGNDGKLDELLKWVQEQKAAQQQTAAEQQRLKELQQQVEAMTKGNNRVPCSITGVNMFANLENIQGQGEGTSRVDLAAKAHAAMVAANSEKKRKLDEEAGDTDGESDNSINSHSSCKNKHRKLKSGIAVKSGQKVRYEVEWAHHWLGKEFDANPVAFNQMKIGYYLMGETDIILNSSKPKEMRARLKLMRKIGYWITKFEWNSVRNIYAAVMRGIETGRESWDFEVKDFEDMLTSARPSTVQVQGTREESSRNRRPRDSYFCGPYQWGDCSQESPHTAKVGLGQEKIVHHICSTCLLKDGKKLGHPNGGQGCPHARLP